MKKIKFATVFLLAPLALCAACSGGIRRLEFQTNWYRNTALGDNIGGTYERLEYAVSMSSSTPHNGLTAEYTDGVYTMTLKNGPVELDETSKEGYILDTSLSVNVKFTFEGKSTEVLRDTVVSHVEFLPVGDNLKPVRSAKTWQENVPVDTPLSLEESYTEYRYTYAVEYDDALTVAEITYTDLVQGSDGKTPEPVVTTRDIEGKTTFLDNEQVLFAMRGVDLTTAPSFRTLSTTMKTVQDTGPRSTSEVTEPVSFERNGEPYSDENLAAYEVRLGYGNNLGQGRTVIFAKKTSNTDNVNRNVPLRIETPIIRSLGILRFTLVKADFADK